MIGHTVLRRLQEAGLNVNLDGERLIVSPSSLLDDDLRDNIRRFKPHIVEVLKGALDPHLDDSGWERMRAISQLLGGTVTDGTKHYQLWGITPRGAICFDGYVLRTLEFEDISPTHN
jgi:hypothetical protein